MGWDGMGVKLRSDDAWLLTRVFQFRRKLNAKNFRRTARGSVGKIRQWRAHDMVWELVQPRFAPAELFRMSVGVERPDPIAMVLQGLIEHDDLRWIANSVELFRWRRVDVAVGSERSFDRRL